MKKILLTLLLTTFIFYSPEKVIDDDIVIDVVIIEETEEETPLRYGFKEEDIYLMTVLLCGSKHVSGDGEYDIDYKDVYPYDQVSLVLEVVMNRVDSELYPSTVYDVIWQSGQFFPMNKWRQSLPEINDSSHQVVREWCESYDNYTMVRTIPESHLYFAGNGFVNKSR